MFGFWRQRRRVTYLQARIGQLIRENENLTMLAAMRKDANVALDANLGEESCENHRLRLENKKLAFEASVAEVRVTRERRFKLAVLGLHLIGVYPGPTALNAVIHGRLSNNLDGRETKWRREAMREAGIPLQRPRGSEAARKQMTGESR